MKAIILAGGFATRLWPLTERRPKPLLLLQNKTLITHIVENIPETIEILVSTNKIFENDFLEWKENEFPNRNIEIFIEESVSDKEKVGALGAVSLLIQEKNIQEDILVLAGDNYFGFSIADFIDEYTDVPMLAVYDIQQKELAKQFGVVVSKDGKTVDAFEEKPEHPSSTLVSTGAYIFPKKNLQDIQHYAEKKNDDLGGIFEYLRSKHQNIHIFQFSQSWFDVGSFKGYLDAHVDLQQHTQTIHDSAKIESSNISGAICISQQCTIKDSLLENVILFPGVNVSGCEIRNSIIDSNCDIHNLDISYKIIREKSCLSLKAH